VTLVKIPTARHPVKVGLSDAYYIDRPSHTGKLVTINDIFVSE